MKQLSARFDYFFRSTKGLVLVAIALLAIVTAFFGTLSGPMREWGITDVVVNTFGIELNPAEREGRIIMLYHTIAVTVVAIEVYIITEIIPMKDYQQRQINATITFGYLITLFFGLAFAYFGHNFVFHGIYLFGLSLSYFAGLQLAAALNPWKKENRITDKAYAQTRKGVSLERMAFFVMAVATLASALMGAITGSYWGQGHETFLAEDVLRQPEKTALQLAIIGHLHIMLTLIAIALALIIGHWLDFKGRLHKWSMWLFIVGTIVVTSGVIAVVPFESIAHTIIYGGSTLVLVGALLLVIFGFDKLIRERLAEQNITRPKFGQRLVALTHDPVKFGTMWQMVFMNFVVSFPGIFMAAKLEDIFRVWTLRDERVILTGHWHVLSGIVATIILLYYADMAGLKGKVRKWFGWIVIVASDIAFAGASAYMLRRMFVSPAEEKTMVSITTLIMDSGLGGVLLALAALMVWRLIDLFKKEGRWAKELDEISLEVAE